jgi:hypothetical protein
MAHKNIAEIMIETLAVAGVKRIHGVVGDSLNCMLEAIRVQKTIEWIGMRHEETAAFAAGAQAQFTVELAVCAGALSHDEWKAPFAGFLQSRLHGQCTAAGDRRPTGISRSPGDHFFR